MPDGKKTERNESSGLQPQTRLDLRMCTNCIANLYFQFSEIQIL